MKKEAGPIPDSYWASPGLLAGEYPGSKDDDETRRKLRLILDSGVTVLLDLTEEREYNIKPYSPFLQEGLVARGRSVSHQRMPIPDRRTPTVEGMRCILHAIDSAIANGQIVYVHCLGGIGRTGTVVGCYMVRHGMSGEQALDEIARLREGTPDGYRRSPENDEQEMMVLNWIAGQ